MSVAIDVSLLLILIVCVWTGYKKGLIMGVGGMIAIVLSLYAAMLMSSAYSYEVVPVLRPFVSGYIDGQINTTVRDTMGLQNTELSVENILENDPSLANELAYEVYLSIGMYTDVAEQMASEAEAYATVNMTDIQDAIVEVACARLTYVGVIILAFMLILILLTAIGNIPNLTFKIPNMDKLNDAGGAVMGLVQGVTFCVLICWALQFFGLVIGATTLADTLLGRFFVAFDFITVGIGI